MSAKMLSWLLAGHLIGVFLWIGGMFTAYWLLRFHSHAPREVHEKLTLMERSIALMMDISCTLAIGCGLGLALGQTPNLFARPHSGWFHIKLAVVVFGVLSVHGMLRAKIKKFGQGQISEIPQWQWSLLIASISAIVILVFVVRTAMLG
ncbi:MAG: CopD family protein [Kofleriaceae bacterium]